MPVDPQQRQAVLGFENFVLGPNLVEQLNGCVIGVSRSFVSRIYRARYIKVKAANRMAASRLIAGSHAGKNGSAA